MTPKLKFEPYDDAFYMGCMWPKSMRLGDGSVVKCGTAANYRVIFESGDRAMLCEWHKAEITLKRRDTAMERGDAVEDPT